MCPTRGASTAGGLFTSPSTWPSIIEVGNSIWAKWNPVNRLWSPCKTTGAASPTRGLSRTPHRELDGGMRQSPDVLYQIVMPGTISIDLATRQPARARRLSDDYHFRSIMETI